MQTQDPPASACRGFQFAWSPEIIGTACAILSAVGYTAANVCLRAVVHCDPAWVTTVKSVPTLAFAAPWLLLLVLRGQRPMPRPQIVAALVVAALVGHFGGNVALQWSFGIVGIALAVPLTLGSMIVTGALLGRTILGESITGRTVISMLLLIISIVILSLGASRGDFSLVADGDVSPGVMLVIAGVGAACLSGLAYSVLGAAIRVAASERTPVSTTLVIVSAVGVVSVGALSSARIGWAAMLHTPVNDLLVMLLGGVCNALAFLALTKALQLTTLVVVNGLNASQVALAAVAGVVFFSEALSATLYLGVALTALGLLLMQRGRAATARETALNPTYRPQVDLSETGVQ